MKTPKRVPLKQQIATAEAEIERITAIIEKIDAALALPDLFTRDPKQAAQLSTARANAEAACRRPRTIGCRRAQSYDEAQGCGNAAVSRTIRCSADRRGALLRLGGLRRRRRLGRTLDRGQAARGEGVDAGALHRGNR